MTRCSDSGYRILAAQSLRKQVKQLAEHLAGVRLGEDIESIHRARVASRRLRAALGMFRPCWKRKQIKAWKTEIGQLARNLGEARDYDVLIEFLASSLAGVSDRVLVPGIACLLSHVERQRQGLQPRLLKAIDRMEDSGVLKAMQAAIRANRAEAGDGEVAAGECARSQAGKSICKRLTELLDESPGLADPDQHERHHAMRIAAKRLRYTLELARPVFSSNSGGDGLVKTSDADLAKTGDAAKKLQSLLGEVHDCDVWVKKFEEFARKESAETQIYFGGPQRFERLRAGLDYLCRERRDRRHQVFCELVAFWQRLKEEGVWDRLATVVDAGGSRAKSRRKSGGSSSAEAAQV